MKKIKIDSNHILIGTFILITGIIIGISLNFNGTFSLEGTSITSSQLATSNNATASNATSTNATSTNATSSNATSANASRTDNIIYLNNFSLAVESAKPGDKVYIGKMTSGACNSGMSISFINPDAMDTFTVNVENMNDIPYFIVPKNVRTGSYKVFYITLVGLNSDNSTFSKQFCREYGCSAASYSLDFDVQLRIEKDNQKEIKLDNLSLSNNEALIGKKVNISYSTDEVLTSMKLIFKGENTTLNVNVLDLNNNPYFNIPSTTEIGEYTLNRVVLMSENNSTAYEQNKNLPFNINLKVIDNSEKTYIYNNSDIKEEIIKELYDDVNIKEIIVNIDTDSVVKEDLFKTIIGTNRKLIINTGENQLIFNGRDIKNPKDIDVTMTTELTENDDALNTLINNGIIVNFVSNGTLPGNALVRLKITDKIKRTIGSNKVYVYYYDNVSNGFNLISNSINPKDGYYEFTISHNSKYVLSTNKLADNLILAEEDNNVVGFRQSNASYLIYIISGLILALIVILIILIVKNKKGKD